MYTQFFKLKEKPFNLSPKASIFHDNSGISPAYQAILEGVRNGEELMLLTGETGTGKTLCAQRLLADLEPDPKYCGITISFPTLPFDEMLGHICAELNLSFGLGQNNDKLEILEMFLTHGVSPIRSVVIVFDEAQNLAAGIFDDLVNLLKINQEAKRKIQIVIMARNESDLKLNHSHMVNFNQSVSLRCQIQPLTSDETLSYIRYQLEAAGAVYSDFFTEEAAARIHILTQGHARPINVLCDHTLNIAASEKETIITADHVNSAYRDQQFDDTIEMHSSQVSEAIAHFANEPVIYPNSTPVSSQLPDSDTSIHTDLETSEPIISETTITERFTPISEDLQDESQIDTQEEHLDIEEKASVQQSPHPLHQLPAQNSNGSFWKVALGSIAVLSIAGLIYYQIQQQRVISDLEKQIAGNTENVFPQGSDSKNEIELLTSEGTPGPDKIENDKEAENTSSFVTPDLPGLAQEDQTVYLQNQQLSDQHTSDSAVQKQVLDEENDVVYIKETENIATQAAPDISEPTLASDHSTTENEEPYSAIDQLLSIAEFQVSELKLTNPKGDNALESYKQILEIDLENVQAREGIVSIKELFLTWAQNNINKPDRARQYYKKALLVDPEDLEVQKKLAELEEPASKQQGREIKSGLLGLAREGNAKDIRTLLEKGAYADIQDQKGNSPLMLATDRGHLEVVQALLSYGANSNLKNKAGDTALINAVWNNQNEISELLIRNKAEINAANNRGWTSLMYAAIHGHTNLFKKLVQNGANLEARTEDRKTSLSVAAHNGQREIVSLLLKSGAQVNIKDKDGWTPLMRASWNNHATVAQILLLNNSNINNRNADGWTPLMLAAWNGYAPIVEMLLKHGANKSITNHDGELAFDLASKQQHYSVVDLLR